ncbi:MAG: FtsW/RodA/SpoVE family cell cycle protein, partial [Anaerolineae bacterium]|nr:FtsW/RodA/SpoVE family cell cycle protein [Anaerolineae bacterium]
MPDRRLWRHFDYLLLVVVALIIAFGVAMIYSASRGDPEIERTPTTQAVTALLGLVVLFVVTIFDYSLLRGLAWLLYVVILALLVGVLIFGELRFEARRWYNLGGFDFQPGELAKLFLGIVIAAFIADRQGKRPYLETVILSGLLIAPCIFLILRQPNLSTALIITFMWIAMVFAGGIESRHLGSFLSMLLAVGVVGVVSFAIFGFGVVEAPTPVCKGNDTGCQNAPLGDE